MQYKFTIYGRFPNMNDFITEYCKNRYAGNSLKQSSQETAILYIKQQLKGVTIEKPIILKYEFYEANKRRDLDNISSFAHKVIQDALVKSKVLKNDGWKEIRGYNDQFYCDSDNPRIEVIMEEVGHV